MPSTVEPVAVAIKNTKGMSVSLSKDLFKRVTHEREGLYNMIQNGQWDETAEKLFVKACHEAWICTDTRSP